MTKPTVIETAGKTAILLVAAGSRHPQAQRALDNIEQQVRQRFPKIALHWAYGPAFIRRQLRAPAASESPAQALERLCQAGVTHLAVQSLQILKGAEYQALAEAIDSFQASPTTFAAIALGPPLLERETEFERIVNAVLATIPSLAPDEAVVLMGHGDGKGPGDQAFTRLAACFQESQHRAFLGTLKGHPQFADILKACRQQGVQRAYLMPFMTVAGNHAHRDLAGALPGAWQHGLEARGIKCIPRLHGLGENNAVVELWLEHLAEALKKVQVNQ